MGTNIRTDPCDALSSRDALIAAFYAALAQLDCHPGGFPQFGRIELEFDPHRILGFSTVKVKHEVRVRYRPEMSIE